MSKGLSLITKRRDDASIQERVSHETEGMKSMYFNDVRDKLKRQGEGASLKKVFKIVFISQ